MTEVDLLKKQIDHYKIEAACCQNEAIKFRKENETFKQENETFKQENETFKQENENLKKRLDQFQQACEHLNHQLQELRRHRFGSKSERMLDADNPQLSLFDEPKELKPLDADDKITVPAHIRRKKKRKSTTNYPREIRIIHASPEDLTCTCGCQKQVIRYETKELFHHKPAEFLIVEQRREVVACRKGCEGSIKTAPLPKHILPKAKATEELLAATIVNKLHHRQPLYHLEKYTQLAGISRETIARWHIKLVEPLQPLYNLLKDEVIAYNLASIDATGLQVLKEPEREAKLKSYLYCMRGGPPDQSVILYAYNAKNHKQFVDNWFQGFSGSVHMDADNFFDLLLEDPSVHAANCNAHARRKFESIARQVKKKGSLAYQAVGFYKKLYQVERDAKREKMSSDERYQYRQEKSKPVLDAFKNWLDENYPHLLPKSPLAKAFEYCIKHWEGLTHYLTDGRIHIDNNHTEQEIKPVVIARKNFMFAHSVNGAHALAMHFSIIRTAILHKLNPYKYYVELFKRLPRCETVEDYIKLLPWNIQFIC